MRIGNGGEGLGPASMGDGTDLVDNPGVALPFMKGNLGWSGVGEGGEGAGGQEGGEIGICM